MKKSGKQKAHTKADFLHLDLAIVDQNRFWLDNARFVTEKLRY